MEFELEVELFVGGKKKKIGEKVNVKEENENIFGMVIMNEWSEREIKKWEYVKIGKLIDKNFGKYIYKWVVKMEDIEKLNVDK
jgi:fumarylacetoacetase